MNHKFERLKMKDCSRIIQNKNKATLSICKFNKPYSELIFYDTDCFCGCLKLFFKVCKCGEIVDNIENNDNAALLITNRCNNYIETILLEGTIKVLEKEKDCCCKIRKDCFVEIEFIPEKITGKRYCTC